MDVVGFVIPFQVALEGTSLLIDLGISEVDIGIGGTECEVLIPVILQTGPQADLAIQRHIRRSILFIDRRTVISESDRPQPGFGESVAGTDGGMPSVFKIAVFRKACRVRRAHRNGCLAEAERALALNPNSLIFLENIGYLMTLLGDWKRGPR